MGNPVPGHGLAIALPPDAEVKSGVKAEVTFYISFPRHMPGSRQHEKESEMELHC